MARPPGTVRSMALRNSRSAAVRWRRLSRPMTSPVAIFYTLKRSTTPVSHIGETGGADMGRGVRRQYSDAIRQRQQRRSRGALNHRC